MADKENQEPLLLETKVKEKACVDHHDKSNVTCWEIVVGLFMFVKFTTMLLAISYAWMWTSQNREIELDIVHELAMEKILPVIYHHDSLFTEDRINSNMT